MFVMVMLTVVCDDNSSQGESGDQVFTCGEALPHLSLQGCPSYRVQDNAHDDMIMFMYVPHHTLHGCSSYSYNDITKHCVVHKDIQLLEYPILPPVRLPVCLSRKRCHVFQAGDHHGRDPLSLPTWSG